MECQRAPVAPRRVRLTDQALVAVTLARRVAATHGRPTTSADLLLGLAAEPDGWAGHLLRRRDAALVALSERSGSLPPGLATLEDVVAGAADRAAPRPPGTRDLLAAALTAGGDDVDDLLAACGFDAALLWPDEPGRELATDWRAEEHETWSVDRETVSLDAPGRPRLSPTAARAVGRVRAVAGGAVDLVALILDDPEVSPARVRGVLRRASAPAPGEQWDAGLDPVLAAAGVIAGEGEASAYHLLQAAVIAGGRGPREQLGLAEERR